MVRFIAACAVALACASPAAAQDKRVALVIGNAAYANAAPMKTALNDANDIGATLGRMGFSVTVITDASRQSINTAVTDFRKAAASADVAMVFYGGRAIESDGESWLIPVDGKLDSIAGITASAVKLDVLISAAENARQIGIVLVDAARTNPFPPSKRKTQPVASTRPAAAHKDMLIGYATSLNRNVVEGEGHNSPFVAALLKHIETPGLEINALMRNVRDDVYEATGGKQSPASYATTSGDRFLTTR